MGGLASAGDLLRRAKPASETGGGGREAEGRRQKAEAVGGERGR